MKNRLLTTLFLILLAAQRLWALAPVEEGTIAIYSNAARIVARQLPSRHLQREAINDELAANAVDILVDSLDFDHTFFLQSDVDKFKEESSKLDNDLTEGKLDFAFEVYDTFMKRVSNRVEYVNSLLDAGFDLDEPEQYVWKRKDLHWASSEKEWNDIWRKKIKNMYIGHLVADQLDEEEAEAEGETEEADVEGEEGNQSGLAAETPQESIRNQYKQLLSVMNDNDAHWLLTLYITAFTRAMDPHSDFMSQRDIEDFNISMSKSLEGIGALLRSEDGAAKIVRLIPGGPAERDGRLKPNDKIIAVAQGKDDETEDIRHWPLSRTVRLIRGEKGSEVVLSIIPASDITGTKIKEITLVRDEVKLEEQVAKGAVKAVETEDGREYDIGVISIPDFYADMEGLREGKSDARSVTKDVKDILAGYKSTNSVDGIVLDLRNNGGGALSEAVDLTGLFIDSGPVVQVKTQSWLAKKLYDGDPEQFYEGPLVVLVNRLSASASEILAAALQDYNRAVIVGDSKTHGKGTVQALLPLRREEQELGSLKLTTAGFYRIAGKSTQIKGVQADIVIPSILDYMEIGEEYQPHALKLSAIKPAFYWTNQDYRDMIPLLREKSLEHRSENPQFQEYLNLLEHIGKRRQSEVVSLDIEERLKTAREERRMQDMALKLDVSETALEMDADEEDDKDLVLKETLKVIANMIELESQPKEETKPAVAKQD